MAETTADTGPDTGPDTGRAPGKGRAEDGIAAMTFEQALAELEAVVARLEGGDVALDESIALYERGAKLRARCQAKLAEAEEKVRRITLGEGGQPTGTQPFDAG